MKVKAYVEAITALSHMTRHDAHRPAILFGKHSWRQLIEELDRDGFDVNQGMTKLRLHEVDLELDDAPPQA